MNTILKVSSTRDGQKQFSISFDSYKPIPTLTTAKEIEIEKVLEECLDEIINIIAHG